MPFSAGGDSPYPALLALADDFVITIDSASMVAEAATRLSDRQDAVPDHVWEEASRHFSEEGLGALVLAIALANAWNRLNVPTRQVTGDWIAQYI